MALSFGKSREEDVVALIAAKKYGRAIEILKAQLNRRGASHTVRKQLADVLVMAGKTSEAVALLLPLADEFARDGFAAKAVSILKKVQKLDPSRRDVEPRLARLIEEKQREAVLPLSRPGVPGGRADAAEGPAEAGLAGASPSLEIGFEMAPISAPAEPPPAAAPRPAATPPPEASPPPVPHKPKAPLPALVDDAALPAVSAPAVPPASASPMAAPANAAAAGEDEIEDYDLLYAAEEDEEEFEVPLEPTADEAMSDGQFADELMSLVDSVFQEFPGGGTAEKAPAPHAPSPQAGSQIVVSPLFRDFSVDEMVAVIQGLKLLSFERGQVIIREGQPGTSLYTLTSGRVRAFRKDAATGKQSPLADLKEGAFFGEISILTGQPRNASIVALSRCELLELDRPALDQITKTHPHVWDVLRDFAGRRGPQAGR